MVVGTDKKAQKRTVETGPAADGKVPVLKGLKAGEMVIVEGAYGMADGTAISTGTTSAEEVKK